MLIKEVSYNTKTDDGEETCAVVKGDFSIEYRCKKGPFHTDDVKPVYNMEPTLILYSGSNTKIPVHTLFKQYLDSLPSSHTRSRFLKHMYQMIIGKYILGTKGIVDLNDVYNKTLRDYTNFKKEKDV